jgi:DeoR/GlpR family transcriptional regulator of sugar metabolism
MDTIGPLSMTALNQVRGYTAFIGADGISMDFGPSANDLASADLHRLVVQNAAATVLLVDHSKFGGASLFQIIDWSHVDSVVTDQEPDDAWKQFFIEREINLVYPGSNGEASVDND